MTTFKALQRSIKLPLVIVAALLATLAVGVAPAMAEFSLKRFAIGVNNENGTPDTQAGSHPYALTTTFLLDALHGDLKDARLELPPGFIGDPDATPKCTFQEFAKQEISEFVPTCANDTAVGVATIYTYLASNVDPETGEVPIEPYSAPVYNLVPPRGVAAEFGFLVAKKTPVLLETSVRAGADYGLTTTVSDVNQGVLALASKVTIWGVPASPAHNLIRGECEDKGSGVGLPAEELGRGLGEGEAGRETPIHEKSEPEYSREIDHGLPEPTEASEATKGLCKSQAPEIPLLTNPTSCGVPRTATLSADSWEEPKNDFVGAPEREAALPEIAGCGSLDFSPTIEVAPEKSTASSPSGLGVDVKVPQESIENPDGQAEGTVRDTTVAMPAGVQVNPSSAGGLQACSEAQVGFTGFKELDPSGEPGVQTAQFKEKVYDPASGQEEASVCPLASKVANVRVKTPVLEGELEGGMYLASPQNFAAPPAENPFESLIALYLVAEEPKSGVIVKLPGKVTTDEATGQLSASFEQTPSLPFSDLHVAFFGGERAPLSTPALCGSYRTEALLTPWSSSVAKGASASFQVGSGPGGSSCTYPGQALPFSPSLTTSTQSGSAGAFSALSLTVGREDGQQALRNVTVSYPPGVSGVLTGVPLCGEAQANAGTCGAGSLIGEASASAGVGSEPYTVTGGRVYLTEHYDGAPFGLSIVTPAVAGPFDLGNVVVRAKVEINPTTAALTATTTGEIPHILDGIPLQLKHVRVTVNRPDFTFNPTDCNAMSVTGSVGGLEGASSLVSDPFQVGDCANLKFTPKFSVSTAGHTSKALGASLTTKVTEPAGALGSQANITRVKVDLPIKLPSQLKTLQKACLAKTFEEGYEKCLKESPEAKVGEAVVYTPLLPVPLKGPAIFVSHGNEAFPSLTMVLQGYGITIDLVGATDIKAGITSTTFKTVPDVPFTSFELTLPQGKFAALTTNLPEKDKGNLCGQNLKMPTEFLGQNGTKINEDTTIGITGCAKIKALTRAQKLQKALKACRKKGRGKRAGCEKAAHQKYGTKTKVKSKKR